VYLKKGKAIKQEPFEEEFLLEQPEAPIGPKNIIVLSEDDSEEMKEKEETPMVTVGVENEEQINESLSLMDSSSKYLSEVVPTSPLETSMVQTLSAMSSLALGPIAPSSSSFSWVQPFVDNKKRKLSSQVIVPNFDALAALLGTNPPPPAKKAKTTSMLVTDSQG
ncbi:hypothetical protein KI387_011189, partial [Taxus chinensis]